MELSSIRWLCWSHSQPIITLLGWGELLRRLTPGEKTELRELVSIIGNQGEWEELNEFEKLEVRKRASILADRFAASELTSF